MGKPLATIGDALNYRAELRANDVARRRPRPGSTTDARPDRGFIEQPEERTEKKAAPPPPPREPWRNPKPLTHEHRTLSAPGLPPTGNAIAAPAPKIETTIAPAPTPAAAAKKRRSGALAGLEGRAREEFRLEAIRRVLRDNQRGDCVRVARDMGITSPSTVWQWVHDWKERYGATPPPLPGPPQLPQPTQPQRAIDPDTCPIEGKPAPTTETLLSRPTPPSTPEPTPERTPAPAPSVTLKPATPNALEAALLAIIDARIDKAYRLQMRKLWQP